MSAQMTTHPSTWRLRAILVVALCVMTVSAFLSGAGLATYVVSSASADAAADTDPTSGPARAASAEISDSPTDTRPVTDHGGNQAPTQPASTTADAPATEARPSAATTLAEAPQPAIPVQEAPASTGTITAPVGALGSGTAPQTPSPSPVALPQTPLPQAPLPQTPLPAPDLFTVQVASFTNPANADALVVRLAQMNFAPSIAPLQRGDRTWTIVSLGPFRTGGEAAEAQNRVRSALGIEPILRTIPGGTS